MKKKIFVLILLLIFPFVIYADTPTTYSRLDAQYYGVNKKWTINEENKSNVMNTPYVDASAKVYDFADILTDEEEEKLKTRINEMIETYNFDIVILTYDLTYSVDSTNTTFATDFYDYNDFGINYENYDGVLLFRNTYASDPYYDMFSFGNAQLYYYDTRMSNILDYIYNDLHNEFYYNGFYNWLDLLESYYKKGKLSNYHVDSNGYLEKDFNPRYGLAAAISAIITGIFLWIELSKHKMVKVATNANSFINEKTVDITKNNVFLVSTNTSKVHLSSGSSGGGGHHSSHSGSSGGGFSSGGGRHG